MSNADLPYEVFARRDWELPLCHVGTVTAPNAKLAQVQAYTTYDEHRWVEMCLVLADEVRAVMGAHSNRRLGIV
ncbi:hypothetical protein MSM1_19075 [Mycobacterium sp. SM1]|uniref:hypothetical protein n=1 Tax=Mycobacterium sp. SM1 TaxID=2816243 RepID=UPI001BCB485B|nr:hypothetical protein [Mycobacterium sp. SM1]MBS4730336.1 hypothetical protein [Mycobacterium sp. SM1]